MYQLVYPTFPGRIRHSDAVYHPVSKFLAVIIQNSDIAQRRSQHLEFSATTSLSPPLPPSTDTSPASFAARDFKLLKQGHSMSRNSSNQKTTTRSFGASMSRGIFKITLKLAGIRRYVKPISVSCHFPSEHLMQTRRGVFQSDPILETLLSYYSSSGIMESLPSEDPGPGNRPVGVLALVTVAVCCIQCSLGTAVLINTWIRLSVHMEHMQLVILSSPLISLVPTSGDRRPHAIWTTLRMTSTRGIGIPSSLHSPTSLSGLRRRRRYETAHPRHLVNVCRSPPLILPLPLVMIEDPW